MVYVTDKQGNRTAVLIPLEEWKSLQATYDIPSEDYVIPQWHKDEVQERIEHYKENLGTGLDFDKAIAEIEQKYL